MTIKHKSYNHAQAIKNKLVARFRGITVPDTKHITPTQYVESENNMTSKVIRRLDVRDGQAKTGESYDAGILQVVSLPKYRAVGEGTRFWIKGKTRTLYRSVTAAPTPTVHGVPFPDWYSGITNNPNFTDSRCSDLWAVHTALAEFQIDANENVKYLEEGISKCWELPVREETTCADLFAIFPGWSARENANGIFPNCWNINSLPWKPDCKFAWAQRPDLDKYQKVNGQFPDCWVDPVPTCEEANTLNPEMSDYYVGGTYPDCWKYEPEIPEEEEEAYEYPFTDCEESFTTSIDTQSLSWNVKVGYGSTTDTVSISLLGVFNGVESAIQRSDGTWVGQTDSASVTAADDLKVSFDEDGELVKNSTCNYSGSRNFTVTVNSGLSSDTYTGTFKVAVGRRDVNASVLDDFMKAVDEDTLKIYTVSYTIDVWNEVVVGASYSQVTTKNEGLTLYAYGSGTPKCDNVLANYNWAKSAEPASSLSTVTSAWLARKGRLRIAGQYVAKVEADDRESVITITPPAGDWTEARIVATISYEYKNNGYTERINSGCPDVTGYLSIEGEDEADTTTVSGATVVINASIDGDVTANINLSTLGIDSIIPYTGAGYTTTLYAWMESYIRVNTFSPTLYLRT